MIPMTPLQSWALLAVLMLLVFLVIRLFPGPWSTENQTDMESELLPLCDSDAAPVPADRSRITPATTGPLEVYDWAVHGL